MNLSQPEALHAKWAEVGQVATETKTLVTRIIEDPFSYIILPLAQIVFIVLIAIIGVRFFDRVIDKIFEFSRIGTRKANTLRKLIKSIAHYTIYFIAALTIMINLG